MTQQFKNATFAHDGTMFRITVFHICLADGLMYKDRVLQMISAGITFYFTSLAFKCGFCMFTY